MLGGWLTVLAGAWFVVGRALATTLNIGDVGAPVASTDTKRAWLELTYFYGLGALIIFVSAVALGRLSVRSLRDVAYAQRPIATSDRPTEPVAESTTAEPAAPDVEPRRRTLGGLFGRRRTTADKEANVADRTPAQP
jgi:hypothetical protein